VNINRKTAIILGILIISGILSGILSSVPALEKTDYLTKLSTIETRVLVAVFFQAVMALAYTGITILLYPIVKRFNETLAAGYFGFRIIGTGFLFVGIASLLLLLWLSQSSGTADPV